MGSHSLSPFLFLFPSSIPFCKFGGLTSGNVNAASCLEMLQTEVWPEVQYRAGRRCWWFRQDGVSIHCTDDIFQFLEDKFRGRGDHPWPPYSPCLSPLDYYFWDHCIAEVFRQKPATMEELEEIVETHASVLSGEIIHIVLANFRRRCQACLYADGGSIEFFD